MDGETEGGHEVSLRERLGAALKEAMRAQDKRRVSTLRLTLAAIKDRDIARRVDSDARDDDVVITEILGRMIKQRHDSIKAYEEGARLELAEQEREEIAIIENFLPRQLSDSEIEAACREVVESEGATGLRDIGRCMGKLKEDFAGRMDFAKASRHVKDLLAG